MRRALAAAAVALLLFVTISGWALESSGVAVIETRAPDDEVRSTHVWHAVHEGDIWLEAGTPENPWFRDVLRSPRVVVSLGGSRGEYLAEPVRAPDGHTRIRALLREKYGLRDCWVGLLVDTSRSVAVRLVPAPDA